MLGRMGYYNYQAGMIHHHIREEGGWEDHLRHCRDFILKAIDMFKPEKVTVLGSGWLLDLPFAEIAESTAKVCLIDIIHPPDVITQVRSFSNVELSEDDVTGGLIAEVWEKAGKFSFFKRLKSLSDIEIPEFKTDTDPGMVISLNITTQLEALILGYVKKRGRFSDKELTDFRKGIQEMHIRFLKKHRSVIISDCEEILIDKSGNITSDLTLLADLPRGIFKEEWTWNFDKPGDGLYNSKSQFRIVALINDK
jgi:hypothetical protein